MHGYGRCLRATAVNREDAFPASARGLRWSPLREFASSVAEGGVGTHGDDNALTQRKKKKHLLCPLLIDRSLQRSYITLTVTYRSRRDENLPNPKDVHSVLHITPTPSNLFCLFYILIGQDNSKESKRRDLYLSRG